MFPVGDWQPAVPPEVLHLRASLLAAIRSFFATRGILEVDTPVLSAAGTTDFHLDSFVTAYSSPSSAHSQTLYLHTSPEFPMKRLLARGSGCIYQIAKVFRNGEAGRLHNPEFTLLEWYRPGFDQYQLMDEVEKLVSALLKERLMLKATERLSYRAVFQHHLGLDPHQAPVEQLAACARTQDLIPPSGMPTDDPDPWLNLLLSHCIEPKLGKDKLTFVYDYPASQAALARIQEGDPPLAERFELYVNGIELANGCRELGDADEQRRRFEHDIAQRAAHGLPCIAIDNNLLAALAYGLPDCAGVALGFDRLLMIAAGKSSLSEVIAFPIKRA